MYLQAKSLRWVWVAGARRVLGATSRHLFHQIMISPKLVASNTFEFAFGNAPVRHRTAPLRGRNATLRDLTGSCSSARSEMAAATNYAALPTTDAISNDEYPPSPNPTRAPPKPSSNQYATRFWPDPTTLAKRAILIAVVAVSAFVFFKVEKGIFQHQLSTDHAAQSGVTEPVAMYGNNGRPRTGRLNVG